MTTEKKPRSHKSTAQIEETAMKKRLKEEAAEAATDTAHADDDFQVTDEPTLSEEVTPVTGEAPTPPSPVDVPPVTGYACGDCGAPVVTGDRRCGGCHSELSWLGVG